MAINNDLNNIVTASLSSKQVQANNHQIRVTKYKKGEIEQKITINEKEIETLKKRIALTEKIRSNNKEMIHINQEIKVLIAEEKQDIAKQRQNITKQKQILAEMIHINQEMIHINQEIKVLIAEEKQDIAKQRQNITEQKQILAELKKLNDKGKQASIENKQSMKRELQAITEAKVIIAKILELYKEIDNQVQLSNTNNTLLPLEDTESTASVNLTIQYLPDLQVPSIGNTNNNKIFKKVKENVIKILGYVTHREQDKNNKKELDKLISVLKRQTEFLSQLKSLSSTNFSYLFNKESLRNSTNYYLRESRITFLNRYF